MSSTYKCTYGTEHKFYHKWTAIKRRKIKKKRQSRIRNIQIFHPVNSIVRSARVPKENKSTKNLLPMIYNSELSSVYGLNMTQTPCKMYELDEAHLYLVEVVNKCSVHFWANLTAFTEKVHYIPKTTMSASTSSQGLVY